MKDLDKRVELLLEASALSLIDVDNPDEGERLKKAGIELCMCMHLEAQTCLLKEMLDALQMMDGRLATLESNSDDEWNRQHNK